MRQYLDVKDRHPDAIVFFRLGDFYEMFFEDAITAARVLDLTLTTRDKGRDDAVPMCGVPHHSARSYVARLAELGHKVVICEQVEDPRTAKGIVKREVTRIITPGLVVDEEMLDAKSARYLAAVAVGEGGRAGLAYLDVSTGEFRAAELASGSLLMDELSRVSPREVLADPAELGGEGPLSTLRARFGDVTVTPVSPEPEEGLRDVLVQLLGMSLEEAGLAPFPLATRAAGHAIKYARATQPQGALPISRVVVYRPEETLVLDETAKTNLELVETIVGKKPQGSLLDVIDQTRTAPGGRLLRKWLLFPLVDIAKIRRRQDAVEFLVLSSSLRGRIQGELAEIHDLERLAGRIKLSAATPRDLGALRRSLERLPALAELLGRELARELSPPELLHFDERALAELGVVAAEIRQVLVDDPPVSARDGGIVRDGFSPDVDELRGLAGGGKDAILAIENRERERTGISSLKVRYNRVFGYYLEVTRSNLKSVPSDYIRKQTLANAERFITPELAELEAKVLHAEERLKLLEAELFEGLRSRVAERVALILTVAEKVATLDALASLAEVAHRATYVRPFVDDSDVIEIEEGRHPVVERTAAAMQFVPNDCRVATREAQVLIITGPNMAGKSTYMRQVAQIALLAQVGSFVPARRARIGIVDRIFTRVGAADNLARGESTFMVEMRETAHILRHATRRSLVILDEIGRGTSTYDGVSIAWAVAEYLHDAVGARTLFATHYHELTELAKKRPRMRNVSAAVREHLGEVVFLRKVVDGGASRSYGIEVARLAGLPRSVIGRARTILSDLERAHVPPSPADRQLSLLAPRGPAPSPVERALATIDPNQLTPLQALQVLADLKGLLLRDTFHDDR
ncbi:MAG: DNA mismatch repair protein MutS [Deltaproteobacteria bacterium]|nr:DNA mismatch repair protein MutS [Deltaproteobacteria bacterium]